MSEQELENITHILKVLVESELYPSLRLLGEGTKLRNVEAERKVLVDKFIKGLPPYLKEIKGYEKIVNNTLVALKKSDKQKKKDRDMER